MFTPADRFIRLFVTLLLVASTPLGALGLSPNLSRDVQQKIDAIFSPWNRSDSPGCSLAVVDHGRIVYERGYGMANLDHGIAITPETLFYVGSVSKQFTAASVALAAREGLLDLDTEIQRYLPEMPTYQAPVRLRHLIHHTSGIRDIYTLMSLSGHRLEDVFTDRQALDLISRQQQLNFKPGTEHLYSNSGYFLLSEIIKRVTHSSLREYAQKRIFGPLDMRDTHFHDSPGHIMRGRATSYQPADDGSFLISYLSNFDKVGAGGLYTTVRDLYKWDQNFYTGKVGGPDFLKQIQTPATLADGTPLEYAFGLTVHSYRGLKVVEHGGSMMGFKAAFMRFPEQEFSAICLCNLGSINPTGLTHEIADVYLESRFTEAAPSPSSASGPGSRSQVPAVKLSPAQLDRVTGSYSSNELDSILEITREGESLRLRRSTSEDVVDLKPLAEDRFRAGNITLRFIWNAAGGVKEVRLDAGRARDFLFLPR